VPVKVKSLQTFPNETKNALKERFGINELKIQEILIFFGEV